MISVKVRNLKQAVSKPVQKAILWLSGKGFEGWLLSEDDTGVNFFIASCGVPQKLTIPKDILNNSGALQVFLDKFLKDFKLTLQTDNVKNRSWKSFQCEHCSCMITLSNGSLVNLTHVQKVENIGNKDYRVYLGDKYPIIDYRDFKNVKQIQIF